MQIDYLFDINRLGNDTGHSRFRLTNLPLPAKDFSYNGARTNFNHISHDTRCREDSNDKRIHKAGPATI